MIVIETCRDLIAVGVTPLAVTDCLDHGSPEKKDIYQQLIDSAKRMAEACEALKTPVVSGDTSLYNETRGTSVSPTPVVGIVGLTENVQYSNDFHPGIEYTLYLVRGTRDDFGGSRIEKLLYSRVNHEHEETDLGDEVARGEAIKASVRNGIALHVQTVDEGDLLITLAKVSVYCNLGLEARVEFSDARLFNEIQGRYVVAVKEGQTLDVDGAIKTSESTDVDEFKVSDATSTTTEKASDIKAIWKGAISECLTTTD